MKSSVAVRTLQVIPMVESRQCERTEHVTRVLLGLDNDVL